MNCKRCNRKHNQVDTLYRVNEPGDVPAVWICDECMKVEPANIPADVLSITQAIKQAINGTDETNITPT